MFLRLRRVLFGATLTRERAPSEVDALVAAYPSGGDITKLMLDFGQSLLRFNDSRAAAIDSKAGTLVAYNLASVNTGWAEGTSTAATESGASCWNSAIYNTIAWAGGASGAGTAGTDYDSASIGAV
jgi:hypothetical protein